MSGDLIFQASGYGGLSQYGAADTRYPCIRMGATDQASGGAVSAVQQALVAENYALSMADFSDGVFGAKTDREVRALQANRGLDVDGIVGPLTGAELGLKFNSCSKSVAANTPGPAVDPNPQPPTVLERVNIFRLTQPGVFWGGILMSVLVVGAGGLIYANETGRLSKQGGKPAPKRKKRKKSKKGKRR